MTTTEELLARAVAALEALAGDAGPTVPQGFVKTGAVKIFAAKKEGIPTWYTWERELTDPTTGKSVPCEGFAQACPEDSLCGYIVGVRSRAKESDGYETREKLQVRVKADLKTYIIECGLETLFARTFLADFRAATAEGLKGSPVTIIAVAGEKKTLICKLYQLGKHLSSPVVQTGPDWRNNDWAGLFAYAQSLFPESQAGASTQAAPRSAAPAPRGAGGGSTYSDKFTALAAQLSEAGQEFTFDDVEALAADSGISSINALNSTSAGALRNDVLIKWGSLATGVAAPEMLKQLSKIWAENEGAGNDALISLWVDFIGYNSRDNF